MWVGGWYCLFFILSGGISLLPPNCASLPFAKHGHTGEDDVFKALASGRPQLTPGPQGLVRSTLECVYWTMWNAPNQRKRRKANIWSSVSEAVQNYVYLNAYLLPDVR